MARMDAILDFAASPVSDGGGDRDDLADDEQLHEATAAAGSAAAAEDAQALIDLDSASR